MTVSIVKDEELARQNAKNEKCTLKLQEYPKKLCKLAKQFQEGFAEEFKRKFKKLKNATFSLVEVDFDEINLLQSRAKQLNSDNFELRTNEFKCFGFLISLIFPIVVSGLNGMYDLITGYHRIKVFKTIFHMKRSWFIVFSLPIDVELTETDLRDMGNIANPKWPDGAKPFNPKDLAWSVVKTAKERHNIRRTNKKEIKKILSPVVKETIDRYNYEYSAFGYMNEYQLRKLKGEVLEIAFKAFDVVAEVQIFTPKEIEPLITKEQKLVKEKIIAPKATEANWEKEVVRDKMGYFGRFKLVCNFDCHGSIKEYREKQNKYYKLYVKSIVDNAWVHWMNEYEMGYGGEKDDLKAFIKYLRKKIDFKYFSPMLPTHKKTELVLVEDEIDIKYWWRWAEAYTNIKFDTTFGKAHDFEYYLEEQGLI